MKTNFLLMLILLAQTFYAQDLTGSWSGELDLQGTKLPLVLEIKKTNNGYSSIAKSPKQGNSEIPVDKTEFSNNELSFTIVKLNASYKGQFKTDHFEGTFTQNSMSFPLNLDKTSQEKVTKISKEVIKDIGNRPINTKKIDEFLNYVSQNKQGIGSLTIFRDGKEIYTKSFGQDQLPDVKWNPQTGYQIGSISKLMTATMLMQLVEKGKLNLKDKLSVYYPEIPNANKITIENMLNHTSGLGDYVGKSIDNNWLFEKPVGDEAIIAEIKKQGVDFQPGEKGEYSNSAYFLLSRILEKIYKKPYNEILKENILNKAGLKNTYSVLDNPTNLFKSYQNINGNRTVIKDFDFHNCIGLGDIVSTTEDLNIFINALFDYKFVKKETLDRMLIFDKKPFPFGLGIMVVPFYNKTSYGHGGDTAGTHSLVAYSPTEKYSIAFAINGEKMPHNQLAIGVLSIIYDQDYKFPTFSDNKKTPKDLQKYAGDYSSKDIPLALKIYVEEDSLFAQATGQSAFPLEFDKENTFKFDKAKISIVFSPEKQQLQLVQNGKTYLFDKTGK